MLDAFMEGHAPEASVAYDKRVLVLIQRRLCIVSSGISVYLKGLIRILPASTLIEVHYVGPDRFEPEGAYTAPNVRLVHTKATRAGISLSVMGVESLRYDLINDYRRVLLANCFEAKKYDCILATDPEGALAASSLGKYATSFNSLFCTHHSTMFDAEDIPNDANAIYHCNEVIPKLDNIRTITQTHVNANFLHFKHGVDVLSYALVPAEPIKQTYGPKEGCLFVGRFEKRKGAALFVKTMAKANVKPIVITGGKNAKEKWETAFKDAGIIDYSLNIGVQGQEKLDILASAKFGFVGSTNESFGFNALEILLNCPLMILDKPYAEYWEFCGARTFGPSYAVDVALELNACTDYRISRNLVEEQERAELYWKKSILEYVGPAPKPDVKVMTFLTKDSWVSTADIIKAYGIDTLMPHEYAALTMYAECRHFNERTEWKLK